MKLPHVTAQDQKALLSCRGQPQTMNCVDSHTQQVLSIFFGGYLGERCVNFHTQHLAPAEWQDRTCLTTSMKAFITEQAHIDQRKAQVIARCASVAFPDSVQQLQCAVVRPIKHHLPLHHNMLAV
jgi:hypothetical protein